MKTTKPLSRKTELQRGKGLERKAPPSGSAKGLRRRQPERIWDEARAKVEAEAACRFCGAVAPPEQLQACHVIGRDRDKFLALQEAVVDVGSDGLFYSVGRLAQPWTVHPTRIVPGHASCHRAYDDGAFDLAGKLTLEEELQAVADSHTQGTRESGLELARKRTAPLAYRSTP